jgi:hypothetical protein
VNDTLSMPDPATQVVEVRQIIQNRGEHSCEATLIAIRRVIDPPAEQPPAEKDPRGWVMLGDREFPVDDDGTAWERHDEPDSP